MSASMLAVVVLLSQVVLFAAREQVHAGLRSLARAIAGTCRLLARWCTATATGLQQRNTDILLEVGRIQVEHKIERELRRLDGNLTGDLTKYTTLSRDLTDLTGKLQTDYQECGHVPPDPGTWTEAVAAAENVSELEGKGTKKMLGDIQKAAARAEKSTLKEYRAATAKRHKILTKMAPVWKKVNGLVADSSEVLSSMLESTKKIEAHMDEFQKIREKSDITAHILMRSARNLFTVSTLVMLVALAGGFINFQLIALPMSELVPAGTRISGIQVSTVAALVLVLMEITVGFFVMDMLGITKLFPRLEGLPVRTKRIILGVSVLALFFLASVEASLAVLREQIVGAENALRQSLAGTVTAEAVNNPATSSIPVIGQAVLGFILPWVLALVAIPLETFIETCGTAFVSVAAPLLRAFGTLMRLLSYVMQSLVTVMQSLYDVYIAVPLALGRVVQKGIARPGGRRARGAGSPAEAHG